MTEKEIESILTEQGSSKLAEIILKQRDKDHLVWFGILCMFCIIFVGYVHNSRGDKDTIQKELDRRDSINDYNKAVNDSLMKYIEQYPVLVIEPKTK